MSAHALAIHDQKILLLLSDNNPNQEHPNSWSIIGGQGEGSETPEQTLLREFKEETTVTPQNYQFLTEIPEANTTLFLVELSDREAQSVKLGNEGVDIRFFSLAEFKELPLYARLLNEYPDYVKLFIGFLV